MDGENSKAKETLKKAVDGLTKVWKPSKTVEPFFAGGKIAISDDCVLSACLFQDNITFIDWENGLPTSVLLTDPEEVRETVLCFCLHPNGKEIVTASRSLLLRHWNIDTKECIRTIKGHNMPVLCMDYDPSGTLVATGAADRCIRVWDIARGYCTHNFKSHTDIVQMVRFHPDPQRLQLFSGGEDCTLRVHDLLTNACIATFTEHLSTPTGVALTESGYIMASVSRDKVLNFYDLRGPTHLKTVAVLDELEAVVILSRAHAQQLLRAVAISEGKKQSPYSGWDVAIVAGESGCLKLYVFTIDGREASTFKCHHLKDISLQPSVAIDNGDAPVASITQLLYSPSHASITVTTSNFHILTYSLSAPSSALQLSRRLIGCSDDILDLCLIPNNAESKDDDIYRLAVVSNSNVMQIINERNEASPVIGHADTVLAVDVSPDGLLLVTSSKDKTCRVWSVPGADVHSSSLVGCVAVAQGHTDAVGSVCISQRLSTYTAKRAVMISGGGDKVLKRWPLNDVSTRNKGESSLVSLVASHSVRAHDKDVNALAMSPNDALVASGSQDTKVKLWNSTDLSLVATLSGHKRGVWRVAFSPVDRVLASCSGDRTVRLWSIADYTCLRTFQGHTASVLAVKFVNHGMQLLSGSSDGLIRLWTVRSAECDNTFDCHTDKVWSIAVDSSKNKFYSAGSDSKLIQWRDATAEEEKIRLDKLEATIEMEQSLMNSLRSKNYDEALSIALELGHTSKVLHILSCIISDDRGTELLHEHISKWTDERLAQIIEYIVDWNTNARHTSICQTLICSLLQIIRLDRLLLIPAFAASLPGLISYSDRHFHRLDKILEASYLMDFMSSQMSLLPLPEQPASLASSAVVSIDKTASIMEGLFSSKKRRRSDSIESM